MKIEFIPKFVALLAGAIVSIITIVKDMDVTYSLGLLLGSLVLFYIVGIIAQKIIQKVISGNRYVRVDDNDGGVPPLTEEEIQQDGNVNTDNVSE